MFLLRALLSECPERGSKVKGLSLRVNAHSRQLLESRERLAAAAPDVTCLIILPAFLFLFSHENFPRLPVSISKAQMSKLKNSNATF